MFELRDFFEIILPKSFREFNKTYLNSSRSENIEVFLDKMKMENKVVVDFTNLWRFFKCKVLVFFLFF